MADWFKFYNDGLDEPRFQYAISDHHEVVSVWLLILSEASRHHSGTFSWRDKDFELFGYSRKLNVSVPIINECLSLLEKIEYIIRDDGNITILKWNDLQSEYCQGKKRKEDKKSDSVPTVSRQCPPERREDETRLDEREEKRGERKAAAPLPLKEVFDGWNLLKKVPQCLIVSDKRRRLLEIRLKEPFFVSNWKSAMEKIDKEPFLQGNNDRGWKASFDWFLQPDSCAKIMEGKYNGQPKPSKVTSLNPAADRRNAGTCGNGTDWGAVTRRRQAEEAARLAREQAEHETPPPAA